MTDKLEVYNPAVDNKTERRNKYLRAVYITSFIVSFPIMVITIYLAYGLYGALEPAMAVTPEETGLLRKSITVISAIFIVSLIPGNIIRFKRYSIEKCAKEDYSISGFVFNFSLINKWYRIKKEPNRYFESEDYKKWLKFFYVQVFMSVLLAVITLMAVIVFIPGWLN